MTPSKPTGSDTPARQVSFDDEPLILVDSDDNVIGHLDKKACHMGEGKLHRAFSIMIFNSEGELLMHTRSKEKPLWPLYRTNSCCSHPRKGETVEDAAQRRLEEELGFQTPLKKLYTFEYKAHYKDLGTEHEMCTVFLGRYDGEPNPNPTEINTWWWQDVDEIWDDMQERPELYSPWFQMELQTIREEFSDELQEVIAKGA
jgi:isopentenyl-diphosphate delta-isomerase